MKINLPYNYRNVADLPLLSHEYVTQVSGVDNIGDLSIEEINEFLNSQEEWYNEYDV